MFTLIKSRINITTGLISLGILAVFASNAAAEDKSTQQKSPTTRKAAFVPPQSNLNRAPALDGVARGAPAARDNILVFSAPPRETAEESLRIYQPIAAYLSRIMGKTVVYERPGNWTTYQMEMLRGSYDIIFDESHLNSWRIANLRHSVLVKFSDEQAYAVIVHKDNKSIAGIKQVAGRTVCSMDPPNLGTLALLSKFDNPVRQPMIINSESWIKSYEGVASGIKCEAAVVPLAILEKLSGSENTVHVIYKTKDLPNQAFSAGPRLSSADQARISSGLLSTEGKIATSRLMATYATKGLIFANNKEYAGLDVYLKDTWGYAR